MKGVHPTQSMDPGERLEAQHRLAESLVTQLRHQLQARGGSPGDLVCVLIIAAMYAELGAASARAKFPELASSPERARQTIELEEKAIAMAREFCDELKAEIEKEEAKVNVKATPTVV